MTCSIRFVSTIVESLLLHLTFGTVYCWGSLVPYVVSYMHHSGHAVDYDEMSWVVSMTTAMQAISMVLGGCLHSRLGLHKTAGLGCCFACLGVFLSSFAMRHGKAAFLASYALTFGFGVGLGYIVPMMVLMKWMPHHKGLASGIVVAGFGVGACVFNKFQQALINPHGIIPLLELGDQKYFDWHNPDVVEGVLNHVPTVLRSQTVVFAVMQFLGVLMLYEPVAKEPDSDAEALYEGQRKEDGDGPPDKKQTQDLRLGQMLCTRDFWILIGNVCCCGQIVLIMAASQKTFGLELLPEVSDTALTNFTGMASLFNGIGRLAWGTVGDWTSFRFAMAAACTLLAILLASLPWVCVTSGRYATWLSAVFFCIGGFFSIFPLATSTLFGSKHMGSNYGAIFMGVAASELLGSAVLQLVLGPRPLFVTCEVLAVLALLGALLILRLRPVHAEQAPFRSQSLEIGYGGSNQGLKIL